MAKNVTIMGANYPDVPAVQLPQTGGGTAVFYDITVVDDLNSSSTTDALSANQGRVLNNKIIEASPDITVQKEGRTIAQGLAALAQVLDYTKLNSHSHIKMGVLIYRLQFNLNSIARFTAVNADLAGFTIYTLQCGSGSNYFYICENGTTTSSGGTNMGSDILFFY